MNKAKIKDLIIESESSKYGLGLSAEDFDENKVRYLRISDIDDNGNLLNEDKKSISSEDIEEYFLKQDDLVVARTGNSTGRTYVYDESDGILAYAGFLIKYVFDKNKINPRYMKYFCLSDIYKTQIKGFAGSTRGNMNANDFKNLDVIFPNRQIQDKMVDLFDYISNKIKNNNKINDELEAMAKTLYDYWFLQFEFPNEEGKPYKSSGGKMVWNDELKREIPVGWEIYKLKDIITTIDNRGKNPPYEEEKTNHPIIDVRTLCSKGRMIEYNDCSKYVSDDTYENWFRAGHPKKGDILFSTVGSLAETKLFYPIESVKSSIAQNIVGFRMRDNLYSYIYQILNIEKDIIRGYKIGSVQPSLKVGHVLEHKFIMPSERILNKYSELMEDINLKVNNLTKENQELQELRDFLLPMLMNGQIGFKEDKELAEANA